MVLIKENQNDQQHWNLKNKNAFVPGGSPGGNEVLELNTKLKTWDKVGTMEQSRQYHAASVANSLDVLNICTLVG